MEYARKCKYREARDLTAWAVHQQSELAMHRSGHNHDTEHGSDFLYHTLDHIQQ